jgi:hypothetical protein
VIASKTESDILRHYRLLVLVLISMTDDIDAEFAARRKLHWQRDGNEWSLRCGRRRISRVIPATRQLWCRALSRGKKGNPVNLSRAKDAVMAAAIMELLSESKSAQAAE